MGRHNLGVYELDVQSLSQRERGRQEREVEKLPGVTQRHPRAVGHQTLATRRQLWA